MTSLVADYSSNSNSESNADDSDSEKEENRMMLKEIEIKKKLPTPAFAVKNSVFSNPYLEEENAKQAVLEMHVKMVPSKDNVTSINGKKICWMYRKGHCRFGINCKYAHDSDLINPPEHYKQKKEDDSKVKTVICSNDNNPSKNVKRSHDLDAKNTENETDKKRKKKNRPGLCQTLVPGKKVMTMYKKTKD